MECIKQFLPLENTVKIIEEGLASLKAHPICMIVLKLSVYNFYLLIMFLPNKIIIGELEFSVNLSFFP